MTSDPLDNLDAFYEECRTAPLPASLTAGPLPTPWWLRLAAPLGGLSIGGLLVLVLTTYPSHPSESVGVEAARALTRSQYLAVAGQQLPLPTGNHAGLTPELSTEGLAATNPHLSTPWERSVSLRTVRGGNPVEVEKVQFCNAPPLQPSSHPQNGGTGWTA